MSQPSLSPVAVVTLVVAGLACAGCDLFAIRCNEDSDCPAEVPFCNADICQVTAGGSRAEGEGEGAEGEGEGACDSDADCAPDLCYDLADGAAHFEAGLVGQCVAGNDDDTSCPEATALDGGSGRPSGGQALFAATASRTGACDSGRSNIEVTASYLDREGDFDPSTGAVLAIPQGGTSPEFGEGSISGDGTSGQGFFFVGCFADTDTRLAVALGQTSPTSNALCVSIPGLP